MIEQRHFEMLTARNILVLFSLVLLFFSSISAVIDVSYFYREEYNDARRMMIIIDIARMGLCFLLYHIVLIIKD